MQRHFTPSGSSSIYNRFSTSPSSSIRQSISHSRPTLGQREIRSVSKIIASGQIAQGEMVHRFEQAMAKDTGTKGAVAVSSGTAALHLTLLAMGLGPKDEVIIPSYVCTALINAVRYVKAEPVLAELEPKSCNIDPKDVKRRLTNRTKAIIVPHLFGLAANIDAFIALDVPIIEDCAQSLGSTYLGKRIGSFGHATICSFYSTKVITTGEGGMVLSDSKDLLDRIYDLRDYDNKDPMAVRYNYKMTDIQGAMGLVQLDRLPSFINRRKTIAKWYNEAFKTLEIKLPPMDEGHIYYRYVAGLKNDAGPTIQALATKGIQCARPVYMPLHRYLKMEGYSKTEEVWRNSLSIPIYPNLTEGDIKRISESVAGVIKEVNP